jgi:predicted RecB family endonuclease
MKRGYKPFVVIRHENEASKSLYKKLGFQKLFDMARIVFTPVGGEEAVKERAENEASHVNGSTKHNGVNNHNV